MQQQVDLVDAVAERRAAALAGPGAAPIRVEVALRPEPQRLAHRDQRPAERAGAEQFRGPPGAGPVPVLEDHVRGAAAGPLRLGDHVQLGQGRTRRLLDQHRPTGPEHLRRDLGVRAGRGGDADQVRAGLAHQAGHIRVRRPTVGVGVRLGVLGHDVDQPDQLGATRRGVRLGVLVGDPAAADDGDLERTVAGIGRCARHGAIMPRPMSSTKPPPETQPSAQDP